MHSRVTRRFFDHNVRNLTDEGHQHMVRRILLSIVKCNTRDGDAYSSIAIEFRAREEDRLIDRNISRTPTFSLSKEGKKQTKMRMSWH